MQAETTTAAPGGGKWMLGAILVIIGAAVLRTVYLFCWSTYDLAPDEAHYWEWSRHLDISYYSKGPLVAWIIRLGWECFGPISEQIQGTLMPAIRLPAVILGALTSWGLFLLTRSTLGSPRLAFMVAGGAQIMPPFAICSLIMTIDAPFIFLWTWALVVGRKALVEERSWAWPVTGMLLCLGILAKPTMALWLFSAGCYCLFVRDRRHLLRRPGFWVMSMTAALSAVPIVLWNSWNGWVTFRHVAIQAGVPTEGKNQVIRWLGPLEYVGNQSLVLLGFWFVAWLIALHRFRPWRSNDRNLSFLWWLSVPTFLIFGITSLKSAGQFNWPVSAYVSGLVLAMKVVDDGLKRGAPRRRIWAGCFAGMLFFAVLGTVVIHHTRWYLPLLAKLPMVSQSKDPTAIRRIDMGVRLKGWRHIARELDEIRRVIRERDGIDVIIAGHRWDTPGQFAINAEGRPTVYSFGRVLGDRHSQYDLWHPNPIDDPMIFRGRSFVIAAPHDLTPQLTKVFARLEPVRIVDCFEGDFRIQRWYVTVGHDFRGIPEEMLDLHPAAH